MGYFKPNITDYGNQIKISGFPINILKRDLQKRYKSSRVAHFFYTNFSLFGKGTISVHKIFLPEMYYILTQLNKPMYKNLCKLLLEKTWLKSLTEQHQSRIKTNKFSDLNYNLKSYQLEFINFYDLAKQKYNLNGYILGFEQGLGKTFTSLALMYSLEKDCVIIICPKSTMKTVWVEHIQNIFKEKKEYWIPGQPPKISDYYIVNYESIDKLNQVLPKIISNKNIGIIVDESHNFTNTDAKRVIRLKAICNITKCKDVLLMSGTPIKALGKEMIPTLEILDPYFDDLAKKIFKEAFGVSVPIALDILNNRLGFMMHRKLKNEVENLPEKTHSTVKIKIPNGNDYTLESVKIKILKFIEERNEYHSKNLKQYNKDFDEVISFLKKKLNGDSDFNEYLQTIKYLRKSKYNKQDKDMVKRISNANKYEKNVLRPLLPPDLRRKFDSSKSAVKYLNLKIMGEVLGGLLSELRSSMFSDMLKNSPICSIIKNSEKKTVCFSTYTEVVKEANSYIKTKCKTNPIMVFGETSKNIIPLLKSFKEDTTINPLIATIQTLSTGVTLVEANTVIFLNKPWRHTDMLQSEDRVHRIGQDTNVFIYTFVLDTGNKPNLSTRIEEIVSWSKEMFEGIIGDKIN